MMTTITIIIIVNNTRMRSSSRLSFPAAPLLVPGPDARRSVLLTEDADVAVQNQLQMTFDNRINNANANNSDAITLNSSPWSSPVTSPRAVTFNEKMPTRKTMTFDEIQRETTTSGTNNIFTTSQGASTRKPARNYANTNVILQNENTRRSALPVLQTDERITLLETSPRGIVYATNNNVTVNSTKISPSTSPDSQLHPDELFLQRTAGIVRILV